MINKLKTLICMTLMRLPMAGTLRGQVCSNGWCQASSSQW